MARRFGPVNGVGVGVIESAPGRQIEASALGVAAVIGEFERGEISTVGDPKYNLVASKSSADRILGGRVDGFFCPDVVDQFWEHGGGAGQIVGVRITDGDELTPHIDLYSRHWGTGFLDALGEKDNQPQIRTPVLRVSAKNAGAWGGRRRQIAGDFVVVTHLTAITLDTQTVMKPNEFAGGTLTLGGVAFKSYEIVSNTAAGVLTVRADATMVIDHAANVDLSYTAVLDRALLNDGTRRGLAVHVTAPAEDDAVNFGLLVKLDGRVVLTYPTLSMDPTSKHYVATLINDDLGNDLIAVTDLIPALTTIVPDLRPANYYGKIVGLTASTVTVQTANVVQIDDANVTYLSVDHTGNTFPGGPFRLRLTWENASDEYSAALELIECPGQFFDVVIPNFSIGAGLQDNGTIGGAGYDFDITIDHAASPTDQTEIVIDFLPLPVDAMVGGAIHVDPVSNPLSNHRIGSATYNTVSAESGDLTVLGSQANGAAVTSTLPEAYAPGTGVDDALLFSVNGRTDVPVTLVPGDTTAALVATRINLGFDAVFGAGVLNPASAVDVGGVNHVRIDIAPGPDGGGLGTTLEVKAVALDAYTVLGLTVATTTGGAGTEFNLSFGSEPCGGHNGGPPSDPVFLDALSISASPLNLLIDKGLGVLQLTAAGVTSTTVQKQGIAYADSRNYMWHTLFPAAIVSDEAAVNHVDNTIGRSDFACCYFPSFVNVVDPDGVGALKSVPVTGMVMGRDAAYARSFEGYHQPAAGLDATLPQIVTTPLGDRIADTELLNPRGINTIRKKAGRFVIWGGRTTFLNSGYKFKSHRLQLSHYEWTFLTAFDFIIFLLNTPATRRQAESAFTAFFLPEYAKGAIVGSEFKDAARIKIDAENNTVLDGAAGTLNAEVLVRFPDPIERFIITVGKLGLFEDLG